MSNTEQLMFAIGLQSANNRCQVFGSKNLTSINTILCIMPLATQIRSRITQLPDGKTFGCNDLRIAKKEYTTAAKTLERLRKRAA